MAAKDDMRAESYLQSFAKLLSQVFFLPKFGFRADLQISIRPPGVGVQKSNCFSISAVRDRQGTSPGEFHLVLASWPCRIIKHISVDYYRCRMMLV